MARDPICYSEVDEAGATNEGLLAQFNAKTYFFCSKDCLKRFERDPGASANVPEWESTDDERSDYYVG